MLTKIRIEKFKSIEKFELDLQGVDVLIGGNNAGKSSALQALQFASSLLQTMALEVPLIYKDIPQSRTLAPERIIYSPTSNVHVLLHGNEPLREGKGKEMIIEIEEQEGEETNTARIVIKKGRNKNISVSYCGEKLCRKMTEFNSVFCMYVPGLAGVPFYEEYRSIGAVRRAAARGDCNTILRNVLYHLYQDEVKRDCFLEDLNSIFPNISIEIDARLENDGMIEVFVNDSTYTKPIDATGTGVLQAIQICAYMNYFDPQLLLLDEPDSHIHPNNQKMLAQMILQLAHKKKNIIISTHSRHLVGALRKKSQITLLKNGVVQNGNYSEYDILMEIGALDEYDVFRDPSIKYVIATEDASHDSNRLLSLVLQGSGYSKESFVILPYQGCSKIESAIYVTKCLKRFRGDLRMIIHRDRDGMYQSEIDEFISNIEKEDNLHCFITKYNDMEMYFCSKKHLEEILKIKGIEIEEAEVESIYNEAIVEIREKALETYLNRKLDSTRCNGKGSLAMEAKKYFEENLMECLNGHLMIGALKSILHKRFHISGSDLIILSEAISDDVLKSYIE